MHCKHRVEYYNIFHQIKLKIMANLRNLKKEIDYTLEEFVFDCDMAMYCQPSKADEIFALMEQSVSLRNSLFERVNSPAEPRNRSLVKKHYSAIRNSIDVSFGELFDKLSSLVNVG